MLGSNAPHYGDPDVTARGIIVAFAKVGVSAQVAQTGGGVATMLIGHIDPETQRAQVLIGPGSYDWSEEAESTFSFDELCIGPDDDGETPATYDCSSIDQLVVHALAIIHNTNNDPEE